MNDVDTDQAPAHHHRHRGMAPNRARNRTRHHPPETWVTPYRL